MRSLKASCIEHMKVSLDKRVRNDLMDLNRADPSALRDSIVVCSDLITHLTGYFAKSVVPCFPPYYKVYDYAKKVYLQIIHDHLVKEHIGPHLSRYMDEAGAEILLEVHRFVEEA